MSNYHQLNDKWSIWYDDYRNNSLSKDYNKNLFLISAFNTIEEFWGIFDHNPNINEIPEKTSFHMMKNSTKPLWEDPENFNGYVDSFIFQGADANEFWKEMMIFIISLEHQEQFDYESIKGISIINKNNNVKDFKIWIRDNQQIKQIINCVNQQMKRIFGQQFQFKIKNHFECKVLLSVSKKDQGNKKFK